MPISKNNFAINLNNEFEGVDVAFLTVDYINTMASETTDPQASANTNQAFITGVYTALFQRPADPGGVAHWETALEQGFSRRGFIDQMLLSDELVGVLRDAT